MGCWRSEGSGESSTGPFRPLSPKRGCREGCANALSARPKPGAGELLAPAAPVLEQKLVLPVAAGEQSTEAASRRDSGSLGRSRRSGSQQVVRRAGLGMLCPGINPAWEVLGSRSGVEGRERQGSRGRFCSRATARRKPGCLAPNSQVAALPDAFLEQESDWSWDSLLWDWQQPQC